ncbi:hypothetical protein [Alicyclobacillus fastidiosus]|uniref:Uncharacterized protein n=1 Tax=Alicyclobacillus fastidiosus TaxID=392011 RepID=A0ABV5AK17_9BACL|nr:hypothetical protein [Alicyclobacillus fastidiosus]WEH10990.1 hypothetical protein PYS47_07170 [Alicyclobacillus fastidiosus]
MEYGETKRHVSFNLNKPEEREMFRFSRKINFSGWVKQQLAREIKRQQKPPSGETSFQVKMGDK